jgi:hypothetical protein
MQKIRNSNFELLRILSMFMIICFHCSFHGKFSDGEGNRLIINFFNMLGELGVNCFVLISGYFYDKTRFKTDKFISLIVQVWFYVILGITIASLFFNQQFIYLLKVWSFPVVRERYWFATSFLLLYLFQPFIFIFVEQLDSRQVNRFVILILTIWCIIPSLLGNIEGRLFYNRFIWMILIYIIGAFLSRNSSTLQITKIRWIFLSTFLFLATFIVSFTKWNINGIPGNYWWPPNSLVQVILSVSLFAIFLKIDIKNNVIINYISSCTFGIYLLHDGVLQSILWNDVFRTYEFGNNGKVILRILVSSLIIFFFGIIADSLYKIFSKAIQPIVKFISNFIDTILRVLEASVSKVFLGDDN